MTNTIVEKIRAGRRAALASLNTQLAVGENVVSIFESSFPRRQAEPTFHSVRHADEIESPVTGSGLAVA